MVALDQACILGFYGGVILDNEVESEAPLRAVTPGQSGVLYDAGGRVLGGGVIA